MGKSYIRSSKKTMMKNVENPLGAEQTSLDGFVVMDSGKNALDRLYQSVHPDTQRQLAERFTVYNFFPERGETLEEFHQKRGPALIIDDVIHEGNTLQTVVRFLLSLGYSTEEQFVFAQRFFPGEEARESYHVAPLSDYVDVLGDLSCSVEKVRMMG